MSFRVLHDYDDTLVVIVPLARTPPAQRLNLLTSEVNIIDLDVEVDAHLRALRLWDGLEGKPWLVIETGPNSCPSWIVLLVRDRPIQ